MKPKLPADKETLIWLAIGIDFRALGQIDPLAEIDDGKRWPSRIQEPDEKGQATDA